MELEFRCWDPEKGSWSYDFVGVAPNGSYIFRSGKELVNISPSSSRCTVSQWTTKLDADGKRIFEGDIIEYFSIVKIVVWNKDLAMWGLAREQGGKIYEQLATVDLNKSKVIGNIFEKGIQEDESKATQDS